MIFESRDDTLYDRCKALVLNLGIEAITSGQIRHENLVINYWFCDAIGCLVLDERENVIDGFVKQNREFQWKDKPFLEHLESLK